MPKKATSGSRAAYDGAKRRKGRKTHIAVDTLGNLLALLVAPANEHDRTQVAELAKAVQEAAGESVEVALLTKVTPVSRRHKKPKPTASGWKW